MSYYIDLDELVPRVHFDYARVLWSRHKNKMTSIFDRAKLLNQIGQSLKAVL
jgi:hypothetical protein